MIGRFSAAAAALIGGLVGGYAVRNLRTVQAYRRSIAAALDAGFTERDASIDGRTIHYAEGPDNGPALLLIHGQTVEWQDYATVLPALARDFHVFAVDCYGHGRSARTPGAYSAAAIGADLARFVDTVIGGPAIVSGHSSGGLIAAWMGANTPDRVAGLVLEDPPFFSTELPLPFPTFNAEDLSRPAAQFLRQDRISDFVIWYLQNGLLLAPVPKEGIRRWIVGRAERRRAAHPGEPLQLWFLPRTLNRIFLALDRYDPVFGAAFDDGSFQSGFDHAQTLAAMTVPTTFIKANGTFDTEGKIFGVPGLLLGATDDEQADRVRELLGGARYVRVDSPHGFHNAHPTHFVLIVGDLAARVSDLRRRA